MAKRMEFYAPGQTFDDDPIVLHDDTLVPYRVLRDVQGIEAPVWSFPTFSTPGVDGVRFGDPIATRPRIQIPVFMWARDRVHLRALKSDLISALRPRPSLGLAKLLLKEDVGTDSGDARFCNVAYRGGLEGAGKDMGNRWWNFTAEFEAGDPFWYTPEPVVAVWVGKPGAHSFFPFTLPFTLSATGVIPAVPLEVLGDADTWPTYDLRGPFTRVHVGVVGERGSWEITRVTAANEVLRLNTKPGEESLRLFQLVDIHGNYGDAGNAWAYLANDSWFRPLRYLDEVSIIAEGTTQETGITLRAFEAWNTAP